MIKELDYIVLAKIYSQKNGITSYEISKNITSISQNTIYKNLKKMENLKFLESYTKDTKKVFKITDIGIDELLNYYNKIRKKEIFLRATLKNILI